MSEGKSKKNLRIPAISWQPTGNYSEYGNFRKFSLKIWQLWQILFTKILCMLDFLVIKWREKGTATLMVLMIGCFGQMTLKAVEHPWCIFMTLELGFSFMGVLAFESKSKALKVAWGLWSKLGLENNTSGEKTTWLCMISYEFTHAHMLCTTCQAHDNKFLQAIYLPQLID
jgi:hypothetical protein